MSAEPLGGAPLSTTGRMSAGHSFRNERFATRTVELLGEAPTGASLRSSSFLILPFHRPRRKTAVDLLLEDNENNQNRNNRYQHTCTDIIVLASVRARKSIQGG